MTELAEKIRIARAKTIIDELKRRGLRAHVDFTDHGFEAQKKAILDQSRAQAWQCTRRAGKTTAFVKKSLNLAVNKSNEKVLYLAMTLDSAKGIAWDLYVDELEAKRIQFKTYTHEGRIELANNSSIKLFGVDSSKKEMRRLLGQKYKIVGIDECGSLSIDVESLVLRMIWPSLADEKGILVLLGTPENIPNTFFQKVTEKKETTLNWSIHKWTARDNPYISEQWNEMIQNLIQNKPDIINASWFKTHYLNEWCSDDSLKIFDLKEDNLIDSLPEIELYYILGVDLGYLDASAFSVLAFNPNHEKIYVVQAHKKTELDFSSLAEEINNLKTKYPIHQIVIDGANRQGVEELRRRHGLTLEATEKTDKAFFLKLLADEVKTKTLLLLRNTTQQLQQEWLELQWLEKTLAENPSCRNDLSDATLYAWRKAFNIRKLTKQKKDKPWANLDQQMIQHFKQEEKEIIQKQNEMKFLY